MPEKAQEVVNLRGVTVCQAAIPPANEHLNIFALNSGVALRLERPSSTKKFGSCCYAGSGSF